MPSLLKDIRNAVLDTDAPIANVVRKCAVLGTQLKNNDLRDWALQELNGYDNENDVPEYRKIMAPLQGNFAGPFGTGYTNITVPAMNLPQEASGARTDRSIRARCSRAGSPSQGGRWQP